MARAERIRPTAPRSRGPEPSRKARSFRTACQQAGTPSSQQKKVTERYWRDGEQLKATVTVEDPMFLRNPASYTMRWLPAPKGYKLKAFDCDPEAARLSVQFIPPKYK